MYNTSTTIIEGELMKIIIPIIIGAIIGYFTNWLAIKMLFRPYYEKKVLGIRLPFTPGLIPKESKRIAKTIGESISNHLITPQALTRALESDRIDENIRSYIVYSIRKIKDTNNTVKEFFEVFGQDSFQKLSLFIEARLSAFIISKIKAQDVREGLEESLSFLLIEITRDSRRVQDLIPLDLVKRLKFAINRNKREILVSAREILNHPTVNHKIRKTIENAVELNIPRIITTFITPEKISEKVYGAFLEQLESPRAGEDLAYGINMIIDKLLENPLREVGKYVNEEDILNISKDIIHKVYKAEEILESQISSIVHNTIVDLGNTPLNQLMESIDEESTEKIIKTTKSLLQRIAIQKLPSIVESLNISGIVEDQINSFDVAYTEELILEIANKELKAITWLGALLGGIMGILTPLLQGFL